MTTQGEAFVLTWQPEPPPILPDEHPPDYSSASRPTTNVRYVFSPIAGQNAMLVVPPAESPDTRPKYYITVAFNMFMPLSYITTVYRGSNEYGERVGEFEMGISSVPARVEIRNVTLPLKQVLTTGGNGRWTWKIPGTRKILHWSSGDKVATCHLRHTPSPFDVEERLAQCKPGVSPYSVLVSPLGQEYFDDIVLSFMAIERQRLTPASDSRGWNF